MRVRIVKPPAMEGIRLDHYKVGQSYDLSSSLANYLVAEGFAEFERREDEGPAETRPPTRRGSPKR